MPAGREHEYFRALPREVREAAMRRYMGKSNIRPADMAMLLDNAAASPEIGADLMRHAQDIQRETSARDPGTRDGDQDAQARRRVDGGGRPLPAGSDGAQVVDETAAVSGDESSPSLLFPALGAAAAGAATAYALGRRPSRALDTDATPPQQTIEAIDDILTRPAPEVPTLEEVVTSRDVPSVEDVVVGRDVPTLDQPVARGRIVLPNTRIVRPGQIIKPTDVMITDMLRRVR